MATAPKPADGTNPDAKQVPDSSTPNPEQTTGETVTIGCKLPHGLVLQVPGCPPVTLKGANSSEIVGGHGITEGVPKEIWDKWRVLYRDFKAFVNGHIFAHEKASSTAAEAKEKAKNPTGLEGLNPDKPAPGIVPENYEGMPKPKG